MASLNEALEFKETINQEEILFLKEKIKTFEGEKKRFELVESRVKELDEENIQLRLDLGKEREKTSQLLNKDEKARQKESQYLSLESDAKSDIYRLELMNKNFENKIGQQQSVIEHLKTQNETLTGQHEDLKRTTKIKNDQLAEQVFRLETRNSSITLERDEACSQLTLTKNNQRKQKLDLEAVKQELEQSRLYCGQLESDYKTTLNNFTTCEEHYKSNLFEKTAEINQLKHIHTELKEKIENLQKEIKEQRDLTKAQFINITGMNTDSSDNDITTTSPLLFHIQEYQKLGKYPEEIYKDFFEMREQYTLLMQKHNISSMLATKLSSEMSDKNSLFVRFEKELESYKAEVKNAKEIAEKKTLEAKKITEEMDKCEANSIKLTTEKKRLDRALQDMTYQLQHLIFDVYKRQDPIPLPVRESARLLTIGPVLGHNLSHEDLAFKNVAGLQNLNRDLSEKIRELNDDMEELKSTSAYVQNQAHAELLKKSKQQLETITNQVKKKDEQISHLEQQVEALSQKPALIENDSDSGKSAFASLLAEFRNVNETFVQYRSSTSNELVQLQKQLEAASLSEQKSQIAIQTFQREIGALQSRLETTQDTLQQCTRDLEKTRHEATFAHNQWLSKSADLTETNKDLEERKNQLDALRLENSTLKIQLQTKIDFCEAIQQEKTESNAERVRLNNMLQSINTRIEDNEMSLIEESQIYKTKSNELAGQLKFAQDSIKTLEKELEHAKHVQIPSIEAQYKTSQAQVASFKDKLAELEAEKSASDGQNSINKISDFIPIQSSCEEHNQMISELNRKIADLEEANEEYVSHVEDVHKSFSEAVSEHKKYVEDSEMYTAQLRSELEERSQSLLTSQDIAEKAKEEYGTMCENLKSAQEKLTAENSKLKDEKKQLEEETEAGKKLIDSLNISVEEQKLTHANLQQKIKNDSEGVKKSQEETARLNASVAELERQVTEGKQKLEDAQNELAADKKRYDSEAAKWVQFQEDINKYRQDSEKNNSVIRDHLDELIDIWSKAEKQETTNENIPKLTNEMMSLIRQHNAVAIHKKEASDSRYLQEYKKRKVLQQDVQRIQVKLDIAQGLIKELEQSKTEVNSSSTLQQELMYDAYMKQNQELLSDNQSTKNKMQEINNALEALKQESEPLKIRTIQLEAELHAEREKKNFLLAHNKEWKTKSTELFKKYKQTDSMDVEQQVKEITEKAQAEIKTMEEEIKTLKSSITPLNEKIKTLQDELDSTNANQASLVSNANQKQRFAFELKNRLNEANKKIMEYDAEIKKLKESNISNSASASTPASTTPTTLATPAPAPSGTPDYQKTIKTLEESLKKEQEAKHSIEQSLKTIEATLKKKTDDFAQLENKYTGILNRAKVIQSERNKMSEEVKALKVEVENLQKKNEESTAATELTEKISECENEIRRLEKELQESEIENGRLKVKNSMSQNKNKRLQDELNLIHGTVSAAATTEQEGEKHAGIKRDREDDASVSPSKKK